MSKVAVLVYEPNPKTTKKVDKLASKFGLIVNTAETEVTNSTELVVRFILDDTFVENDEVDILVYKGKGEKVDEIIQNAKPRFINKRYLFMRGTEFKEYTPFKTGDRITRVIQLGGEKYLYAFNIQVGGQSDEGLVLGKNPFQPSYSPHTEINPFSKQGDTKQIKIEENAFFKVETADLPVSKGKRPPEGYICRLCNIPGHYISSCEKRTKVDEGYVCRICGERGHLVSQCGAGESGGRRVKKKSGCWFCISNEGIEKELIIYIGDALYLALPKGGITSTHLLIIPIEHYKSTRALEISNPMLSKSITTEKIILLERIRKINGDLVTYEVFGGHGNSIHYNLNVIPLPEKLHLQFKDLVVKECKTMGMGIGQIPVDSEIPFIKITLSFETLVMVKKEVGAVFEFNIVRKCLCSVLGMNDRVEWRNCGEMGIEELEEVKERYAVLNL